jgi:hypothetical protein
MAVPGEIGEGGDFGYHVDQRHFTSNSCQVSWWGTSNTTGYRLYRNNTTLHATFPQNGASIIHAFTVSGLLSNEGYFFTLCAYNAEGEGPRTSLKGGYTLAGTPTISVGARTTTSIGVSWTGDSRASGFNVYAAFVKQNAVLIPTSTTTFTVSGLTANVSRYIHVVAVNSIGLESPLSGETVYTLPNPPVTFSVGATTSNSIALSWSAPAGGASSYGVYNSGTQIATGISGSATSTILSSLSPNTNYVLTMKAVSGDGNLSEPSNSVSKLTLCASPLLSVGAATATTIPVSWTTPTNGAGSYTVNYGTSSSSGLSGNATTLSVSPNTSYDITVVAVNGTGSSLPSNSITKVSLPLPPSELVKGAVAYDSITFSWLPPSGGATSYQIYKDGQPYGSPQAGTSVTATGLTANALYTFEVYSIGSGGTSSSAASLSATTAPAAPTSLAKVGLSASDSVTFSWTAPAGATSYQVYKDGQPYGVSQAETSATVTGLSANTSYNFVVQASSEHGQSPNSSVLSLTTAPAAPTSLAKVGLSTSDSVSFSWTAPAGATSYQVYKDGQLYGSPQVGNTGTVAGLLSNTSYEVSVKAISAHGESFVSSNLSLTTAPAAPIGLYQTQISSDMVSFGWEASAGATSYQVYRDGVPYGVEQEEVTVDVNGLISNVNYNFTVVAKNSHGNSFASTALTLLTLLNTPSGLGVSGITASGFTVSWGSVTGATSYEVYGANGVKTAVTNSLVISALEGNTSYNLTIKALRSENGNFSLESLPYAQKTKPNIPTGLAKATGNANSIVMQWDTPPNGADSYKVKVNGIEQSVTITPV